MRRLAGLLMIALLVTACRPASKEDIVAKTREVKTRAKLERALGKPDDVSKLGPLEKWTYKARNGQVVFVLVGDVVTLEAAAGPSEKKD
jgi:hypothetical protein